MLCDQEFPEGEGEHASGGHLSPLSPCSEEFFSSFQFNLTNIEHERRALAKLVTWSSRKRWVVGRLPHCLCTKTQQCGETEAQRGTGPGSRPHSQSLSTCLRCLRAAAQRVTLASTAQGRLGQGWGFFSEL